MPVRLTILGSGSSGNCAYLETDEARILIDAGFSLRQIRKRLESIGRAPENLTGILITHEHSDHVQGLASLAAKLNVPVYWNRPTQDSAQYQLQTKFDSRLFTTGATFDVGDVVVETFTIPHDAQDPVGFLLRTSAGNIGVLTDLGHATQLVLQRVKRANVLVLESNHDVKMLQDCPHRPWSLKQRILGRHGHLSNEAAAAAIQEIISADLQHLYLGHLSRECNKPELALAIMAERLDKLGASHVRLEVAHQGMPSPTLELSAAINQVQLDITSQFPQMLKDAPILRQGILGFSRPGRRVVFQARKIESFEAPELHPYRTMRRQVEHREQGLFVAEGEKVVRRLLESRFTVVSVLLPEKWLTELEPLLQARPEQIQVFVAEKKLLETLTGFSMYQGLLAVGKVPPQPSLESIFQASARPWLLAAVDSLSSAENLGALVRTGAAFNVQALLVGETCTSPFLRRAVRSSMGTVFELPIIECASLVGALGKLRASNVSCVAAHPHVEGQTLPQANLSSDCCIVFGSEGYGISPQVLAACNDAAAVPMPPRVDSLNVGAAAAVFLYEANRQRGRFGRV